MSVNRSGFYKWVPAGIIPSEKAKKKADDIALVPDVSIASIRARVQVAERQDQARPRPRHERRVRAEVLPLRGIAANAVITVTGSQVSLGDPTRT
jgi:hypothetical protein